MNKTVLLGLIAAAVLGGVWWLGTSGTAPASDADGQSAALQGEVMTVYKTPSCGCCGVYAQYLEGEDVAVNVENLSDLSPIKTQYGIPTQMQSCHTSVVAGYVVEGHMPLAAIEKLLTEKPDIAGIMLPGMPSGSPGMPGPQTEPWVIYALERDGSVTEFMTL